MQTIKATFRIVTPMFIAGADQQKAELRAPSIKGALRFWWRALNWCAYKNTHGNDALDMLRNEEQRLFGSGAGGGGANGVGSFLLHVTSAHRLRATNGGNVHDQLKPTRTRQRNGRQVTDETHLAGARYLGYGVVVPFATNNGRRAGQLERSCLNDNQKFFIELVFKGRPDEQVIDALKLFGLLGGLGSRSRRGFGSIAIEEIEENGEIAWRAPTDKDSYIETLRKMLKKSNCPHLPELSAFYKDSRIDVVLEGKGPYDVLDHFGLAMLDYRSWGRTVNGRRMPLPSGRMSEERFEDDHNWFRKENMGWRRRHPGFHPKRVVFGLPHNYDRDPIYHVIPEKHERRASPLLFHVHRLRGDLYLGVTIFLKSRFLPAGEKIRAGDSLVTQSINWNYITDFIDGRIGNPPAARYRFSGKRNVL